MSMRRNIVWTILSQTLLFTLQFGLQVLLARLLSPREIGIYSISVSTSALISAFQSFGLQNFLIREQKLDDHLLVSVFSVNLIVGLVLVVLINLGGFVAAQVYSTPAIVTVMRIQSMMPMIACIEFLPGALLQRQLNFQPIAIAAMAKVTATFTVTLLLVRLGYSYLSLAWGSIAGAIASAAVINLIGRRYIMLRLGLNRGVDVFKFGIKMLTISGVSNIAGRTGELILAKSLGLSSLAIFNRASMVNSMMFDNIHSIFIKIVFADFSEKLRTIGNLRSTYLQVLNFVTIVMWPAFLGISILSPIVINVLYGPKWSAAAPILSILAISGVLLTSVTMVWEVFVVMGRTTTQAKMEIIRATFSFFCFSIGSLFSITGAAAARVADAAFVVALYRRQMNNMTSTADSDKIKIYAVNFFISLFTVAPSFFVMWYYNFSSRAPLLIVSSSVVLGLVIWCFILIGMDHPAGKELILIAARALKLKGVHIFPQAADDSDKD